MKPWERAPKASAPNKSAPWRTKPGSSGSAVAPPKSAPWRAKPGGSPSAGAPPKYAPLRTQPGNSPTGVASAQRKPTEPTITPGGSANINRISEWNRRPRNRTHSAPDEVNSISRTPEWTRARARGVPNDLQAGTMSTDAVDRNASNTMSSVPATLLKTIRKLPILAAVNSSAALLVFALRLFAKKDWIAKLPVAIPVIVVYAQACICRVWWLLLQNSTSSVPQSLVFHLAALMGSIAAFCSLVEEEWLTILRQEGFISMISKVVEKHTLQGGAAILELFQLILHFLAICKRLKLGRGSRPSGYQLRLPAKVTVSCFHGSIAGLYASALNRIFHEHISTEKSLCGTLVVV